MRCVWLVFLIACGGSKPISENRLRAELTPALEPLEWWVGDWQVESGDTGTEQWVAASGALYGIALHDGDNFEVMIVDDGEGTGKPDGVVRFIAMPAGAAMVEFKQTAAARTSVTFANPEHDAPKQIAYTRDGDALIAKVDTTEIRLKRTSSQRARELEQADIAFANDTAKRGIDGWVAAFDEHGAQMRKAGRVEGHDAIRELMGPLLAKTKVAWAPIASGKRGQIGWTVGKATFTGEESWQSTYVTIWKQQSDGSWKVLFDTGRPVQAR